MPDLDSNKQQTLDHLARVDAEVSDIRHRHQVELRDHAVRFVQAAADARDAGVTAEEMADRLGRNRSYIYSMVARAKK